MPIRQVWFEESSKWKDQIASQVERAHCWPCSWPRNASAFVRLIHSITVMWKDTNSLAHLGPACHLPSDRCLQSLCFFTHTLEATAKAISTLELGQRTISYKTAKTGLEPISFLVPLHPCGTKPISTLCRLLRATPENLIVSKLEGKKTKPFRSVLRIHHSFWEE